MTEKQLEIRNPVIILVGPTAIGKTSFSIDIAETYNCEVVSVDSMQVYRFMNIGTAKVMPGEMRGIEHHLIDIVNPDEDYHAARFINDARQAISEIHRKGRIALLTGGTGLYLNALKNGIFENVPSDKNIRNNLLIRAEKEGIETLHQELLQCDEQSAQKIHKNDVTRIIRALEVFLSTGKPLSVHIKEQNLSRTPSVYSNILSIGLNCNREQLYQRINKRTSLMIEQDFEKEVLGLIDMGYNHTLKSMQSIGYRHMLNYIAQVWTKDELLDNLCRDTRRYAKRQLTWFKKDTSLKWFDRKDHKTILSELKSWLSKQ